LHGKALFQNNYGVEIYISDYSTVVFNENSDVASIQNYLAYGLIGIITLTKHSSVLFDESSI